MRNFVNVFFSISLSLSFYFAVDEEKEEEEEEEEEGNLDEKQSFIYVLVKIERCRISRLFVCPMTTNGQEKHWHLVKS